MRNITGSCFLLLLLCRLSLLALLLLLGTSHLSLRSPLFLLHAHAQILFSLANVRLLLILTLFHLTIWCSEQMALLLFILAKTALAYFPTALSVALRSLFPFQQAQYVHVVPLKPAPFCKLFANLSTTKSATSFLLVSDSHPVLATLSSPPSFLLLQSLRQIWQELGLCSSSSIRLQWVSGLSFLPRNNAATRALSNLL